MTLPYVTKISQIPKAYNLGSFPPLSFKLKVLNPVYETLFLPKKENQNHACLKVETLVIL